MAGVLVSLIGAVVGSTVAVLFAWASVGTCLGCLSGVFLVLLDGGTLLRAESEVSVLFGALIAASVAFSWAQVCVLHTSIIPSREKTVTTAVGISSV